MITDAVIKFFQQVVQFLYNLIPDAAIVAAGNGAASGSQCCATFLIDSLVGATGIFQTATINNGGTIINVFGSAGAAIKNNPVMLIISFSWLGFAIGCGLSILTGFLIVKILITFWTLVKW